MVFDMSSNHPACSPSVFGHTNNADTRPFGTMSPFGAQTGGSNSSSTGVFVGTQASSPIGSTSVFGSFSLPASGTTSAPPFGGSSVFEQNPASERSGFNTPSSPFGNPSLESQPMRVLGTQTIDASSKPAFGVSSIPASASSVTPAFGVSNSLFGSTTPAFGTSPTPAYCSTPSTGSSFRFASAPAFNHSPAPFNVTSIPASQRCSSPSRSPFSGTGPRATTLEFGDHGFSLFKPAGSRVYSYALTPEEENWPSGRGLSNLVSMSAMPAYKGKTHEELRWEDYQSGDKGDPNTSGGTELKTNNMWSNLFPFGPATSPFFQTLKTSPLWPPTSNPSAPAQSQTPSQSSYPFGTPASPSLFGTPDTSNTFVPVQAQTPSVFSFVPSNPFGPPASHSLFGPPNTSGFGTPSSVPTCSVSITVAFGAPTTQVSGAPAFTASSTPAFASFPAPAYGAPSFSFSFSFPVFGQSESALGSSSFGPFGAHAAAPDFASYGSGKPYQQHVGSISPPYAQKNERFSSNGTPTFGASNSGTSTSIFGTTQARGTNSMFGNTQSSPLFQSSSAAIGQMNSPCGYTGPDLGQCMSPSFGFSTSFGTKNTSPSGTSTTPGFGATMSPSPFGTPNPSSASGTSTTAPGFKDRTGPSPFGNSTPSFETRKFSTPNTSSFGTSTSTHGFGATMPPSPFGTPNTSSSGTSSTTPGFGARTPPSPFETSNTSTSVSGITRPSPFGSGLSLGTQSANLFQSSSPDLGEASSLLAQTGLALEQSTPAVSQSNASEGTFSCTQLRTSSMGFNNTTSSFSTSSQFAQLTQSPASSHLVETTGGTGSTSIVSIDDQDE